MAKQSINFDFQESRLVSVHLDTNPAFKPGKDIQLQLEIKITHNYLDSDDMLLLTVGIEVKGEDSPINLSAVMGGSFKFNRKPDSHIELMRIAEIQCTAIIFPFLREVIADITRRSGLPPLLISPINFVEFFSNNHPELLKKT